MSSILSLIGRSQLLFQSDLVFFDNQLTHSVSSSSFLILGAAGTIGQAVSKEIFKRNPLKLHLVDVSENNMVELVRDIRSCLGYLDGDFRTFSLDIGSIEYDAFIKADGCYDYVLNLSALKHVRSEKDPFTLMRMVNVNILNTDKTVKQAIANGSKKYFCVSTDKAANPVNMMGASKRIMEMYLQRHSGEISISTARFANVAFSDGSLLHGFNQRIEKIQPIVAPRDVKRYFLTPEESGQLCLLSCILGDNRDIFFPKLSDGLHLISFADIAVKYLDKLGYEPQLCFSENESRELIKTLPQQGKWPCLFTLSDTTGEKDFEEFFTENEALDMQRFNSIGIVKSSSLCSLDSLSDFEHNIDYLKQRGEWTKQDILALFQQIIPNFAHINKGKYLDSKM